MDAHRTGIVVEEVVVVEVEAVEMEGVIGRESLHHGEYNIRDGHRQLFTQLLL